MPVTADSMVTADQMAKMYPRAPRATILDWHPHLAREMQAAGITTTAREAAFLASVGNETGGLIALDEALDGSYFNTPWSRIQQIFGGIKGLTQQRVEEWKRLGRQGFDEAFFNHVYADANRGPRYGLGNTQPGDGYKYRGMGPGALTGRGNFTWMARETGLPLVDNPELIKTPAVGAKLAAHFWVKNGCNAMVDDGSRDGALQAFRKLNAGLRDFSNHMGWWERCRDVLASDSVAEAPPASTAPAQKRTDVIAMQRALVARGFDTGGIDGVVGPKTREAIADFETSAGLPRDGVADEAMLRALLTPPPTTAPGTNTDKLLAAATTLAPAATPFLTADWKVIGIIAAAALAGLLIWRLHQRGKLEF